MLEPPWGRLYPASLRPWLEPFGQSCSAFAALKWASRNFYLLLVRGTPQRDGFSPSRPAFGAGLTPPRIARFQLMIAIYCSRSSDGEIYALDQGGMLHRSVYARWWHTPALRERSRTPTRHTPRSRPPRHASSAGLWWSTVRRRRGAPLAEQFRNLITVHKPAK
jgi:hypothetical protein